MLALRSTQSDLLHESWAERIVPVALGYARRCHAQALTGLDEHEREHRVTVALERGWAYGLRSDRARIAFVGLMLELGPDFDRHPAFAERLCEPIVDGDEDRFIRRLWDEVSDEAWIEAWSTPHGDGWTRRESLPTTAMGFIS
ncbi:MAG: hypothetical protein AAF799_27660 [Myxococcota bacterium]